MKGALVLDARKTKVGSLASGRSTRKSVFKHAVRGGRKNLQVVNFVSDSELKPNGG